LEVNKILLWLHPVRDSGIYTVNASISKMGSIFTQRPGTRGVCPMQLIFSWRYSAVTDEPI
jgi:hypothetical protein